MAPSWEATSITWSVGTNRNSASLSTNFLMSQGQATRSTLTRSRVIHFIGMFSFSLNGHHIDDKRHQGEQHPRLLKAYGIGRTMESGVPADEEIGDQGTQDIIGTHAWNGVIVQRTGIARRSPDDDRDADDHRDQQTIDKRKRLEAPSQGNQHQQC